MGGRRFNYPILQGGDNQETKGVIVTILVCEMPFQPVLRIYYVSSNYFIWYLSYGA